MLGLTNKSILFIVGISSLSKQLTKRILQRWPKILSVLIHSRDEQKQLQMAQEFSKSKYSGIHY